MSNALHDYAKLFEKYAAANGGWGVILAGEDCLSLANEMMIDADALEAENAKLRELVRGLHAAYVGVINLYEEDEESLIWEYSGSIETDMGKLRGECDEARHRFDVALRELGVEVDA